MLDWRVEPVQKLRETRTGGVIVCNPPYGERLLEKQSAEELYRQMHGIFSRLDGWSVNIIASHPDLNAYTVQERIKDASFQTEA